MLSIVELKQLKTEYMMYAPKVLYQNIGFKEFVDICSSVPDIPSADETLLEEVFKRLESAKGNLIGHLNQDDSMSIELYIVIFLEQLDNYVSRALDTYAYYTVTEWIGDDTIVVNHNQE